MVFDDYKAAVQLLLCLCKLAPVLLSADIVSFLRFTGVTVSTCIDSQVLMYVCMYVCSVENAVKVTMIYLL